MDTSSIARITSPQSSPCNESLDNTITCSLRQAMLSDISSILEVENDSFDVKERFNSEIFTWLLISYPELFLVLECGNEIAGYAAGVIEANRCQLVSIAVKSTYRGRRLGKCLLRAFEDKCLKFNVGSIRLEVKVSNNVALRLYLSEGYRVIGKIKNYYSDGSDALLLEKRLSNI
ncbi:MAG: ribosomal protein S18-alanine N-acetyltransferase [Acidilobaceae archaeon]